MDNPFSSGGFGDDSNAFGAPAFGSENCSETYPGMPPPIDWSATSGGGFGGESNITNDPMAAPSFGGAMGGLSTAAHLAQEHPEIMKASMDGFAAAAQNPSDPPATMATSIAGAVAPAFAIEAQEALNTVTSSVAAALKPGQSSGPMFEITVSDPVAQKSGMMGGTHMTYKVNVKTSLPQYQWREFSQIHRYSDFEWLNAELKDFHPNCVVPPIPEKVSTGNTDPEFVARRMWGLQHFLQHCADHPELRGSRSLQFFLEANTETMPEMKKAAQKQKDQAPGLWRRSKMAFKKLDKKYVDPELESQKAALQTLQNTVQRVGNYTARLEPGRKQVSATFADIGVAFGQFAESQDCGLANSCRHTAEHYSKIGEISREFAAVDSQAMHTVLDYQCGLMDSCGDIYENRKVCAMALQSYQQSVDSAQSDHNKYKDNSSKAAKAAKAHATLTECQGKLEAHQESYTAFAAALPVELSRFDDARKKETLEAMLRSAEVNQMYHQQMQLEWTNHLEQLRREVSATF